MLSRILFVFAILSAFFANACSASAQGAPSFTALDRARATLNSPESRLKIGDIDLTAFDFARELEIGHGIRVIAISTNDGGGLAAFRSDGSSIETFKTEKITWLQLFDLNEDGVSEIVTEEVDGRGTGVLQKSFNLYGVSTDEVKKLWHAESYSLDANFTATNGKASPREQIGYLRFDPGGFGLPPRMAYLLILPSGVILKRESYEMRDGTILKASEKLLRK